MVGQRLAALSVVAAFLLVGCSSPPDSTPAATTTTTPPPACGHSHVTFAIYLQGASPILVDFLRPRAGELPYYDYAASTRGGAPTTAALHMHMLGPEAGAMEVARKQWHMEAEAGPCPTVESALAAVDVVASASVLDLRGGHLQVPGQGGVHRADDAHPIRWFWRCPSCTDWTETSWDELRGRRLEHGARLLGTHGMFADRQVLEMQGSVPQPSPA
jgi:hypothetical protein